MQTLHRPVDQFECNPYLTRKELRNYCKKHNIVPEAWSPLARGACFDDPVLQKALPKSMKKNIAQIILRYDVQKRHRHNSKIHQRSPNPQQFAGF